MKVSSGDYYECTIIIFGCFYNYSIVVYKLLPHCYLITMSYEFFLYLQIFIIDFVASHISLLNNFSLLCRLLFQVQKICGSFECSSEEK